MLYFKCNHNCDHVPMKKICLVISLVVIAIPPLAHARMYQWLDPDTGTTQLSGKPPGWYRNGKIGPRVFVFDNGKIIDDTDIVLSDAHRDLMRQRAFIQADEDLQRAKERAIEAGHSKTASQKKSGSEDEMAQEDSLISDEDEPEVIDRPGQEQTARVQTGELSLEDMKQLISDWEKAQEEKAKQTLGN